MTQLPPEEDDQPGDAASRVYHYKKAGESFASIAEIMNLTVSRVRFLYNRYMTGLAKYVSNEEHQISLAQELERLDEIQLAFYRSATEDHEVAAAKVVLDVMKMRHGLTGLDNPNPTDMNVVHKVLIISSDRAAFLDALQQGRQKELVSADPDNDIVGEVSDEEALG